MGKGFIVRQEGRQKDVDVTGAQRDNQEGKLRFDLIGIHMLRRVAVLLAEGAKKYSERNWEKGQRVSRTYASLFRHLIAYAEGDRVEDHLASVVFNAMSIMHVEEEVQANRLPRELLDMEFYSKLPEFNPVFAPTAVQEMVLAYIADVHNPVSGDRVRDKIFPYADDAVFSAIVAPLIEHGLIIATYDDNSVHPLYSLPASETEYDSYDGYYVDDGYDGCYYGEEGYYFDPNAGVD